MHKYLNSTNIYPYTICIKYIQRTYTSIWCCVWKSVDRSSWFESWSPTNATQTHTQEEKMNDKRVWVWKWFTSFVCKFRSHTFHNCGLWNIPWLNAYDHVACCELPVEFSFTHVASSFSILQSYLVRPKGDWICDIRMFVSHICNERRKTKRKTLTRGVKEKYCTNIPNTLNQREFILSGRCEQTASNTHSLPIIYINSALCLYRSLTGTFHTQSHIAICLLKSPNICELKKLIGCF